MSDIVKLSDEEIKKLRLIELEMLIEVDRICEKNGISYSLDGGTLLGAVRHQGFIPWDDDLDVTFKHEEYEKFFVACQKDLDTSRFFFQDFRTDKNYRWGYGKLRRLDTEYIKKGQEHLKQKTGVCIDVFDYQYLPDDVKEKKHYQRKMFCIRKIAYSSIGKYAENTLFMRLWYTILSIIPMQIIHKIRMKELAKNNKINSAKLSNEMFPTARTKNGVDSTIYDEYCKLEFEGMKFNCFKKYDEYLKILYGDYMTLPPIEKRQGVMDGVEYELIDVDYEELLNQYQAMHEN